MIAEKSQDFPQFPSFLGEWAQDLIAKGTISLTNVSSHPNTKNQDQLLVTV